jgi:hypothetical protein
LNSIHIADSIHKILNEIEKTSCYANFHRFIFQIIRIIFKFLFKFSRFIVFNAEHFDCFDQICGFDCLRLCFFVEFFLQNSLFYNYIQKAS